MSGSRDVEREKLLLARGNFWKSYERLSLSMKNYLIDGGVPVPEVGKIFELMSILFQFGVNFGVNGGPSGGRVR